MLPCTDLLDRFPWLVRALLVVATGVATGCGPGTETLTIDELILGPGIAPQDGGPAVTWDGVTTLDEAMFVEASADLAYSDAVALALEYSKSLPSPSPVGNATITSRDGEQSAAISGCRLPDDPTFVCIVDGLEFGGDIVESGVRLRLELSNEGTPQYNPFADFEIDIEGEREPAEWLMNVGPDTGGSVLFVRLQWNFRGSL